MGLSLEATTSELKCCQDVHPWDVCRNAWCLGGTTSMQDAVSHHGISGMNVSPVNLRPLEPTQSTTLAHTGFFAVTSVIFVTDFTWLPSWTWQVNCAAPRFLKRHVRCPTRSQSVDAARRLSQIDDGVFHRNYKRDMSTCVGVKKHKCRYSHVIAIIKGKAWSVCNVNKQVTHIDAIYYCSSHHACASC